MPSLIAFSGEEYTLISGMLNLKYFYTAKQRGPVKNRRVDLCSEEGPQEEITNFGFLIEPVRNNGDMTVKEKKSMEGPELSRSNI